MHFIQSHIIYERCFINLTQNIIRLNMHDVENIPQIEFTDAFSDNDTLT